MSIIKAKCWIAAALCAASCATAPDTYEWRLEAPNEEGLEGFFETLSTQIHLPGFSEEQAGEHVRVLIAPTFNTIVGVSTLRERMPDGDEETQYAHLSISIWDHPNDPHEVIGDVSKFTQKIDRYWTEISDEEFETVVSALRRANFFKEKTFDSLGNSCTDGTIYYIEANFDGERHLVARHTCDKGYKEKIKAAAALFDLACKRAPMTCETLQNAQAYIEAGDR